MEISPIVGTRVLPVARVQPHEPGLHALFDIDAAVRPDDDAFRRNQRQAAGAEEPEEEEDALKEKAQASGGEEINSRPAPEPPSNLISLFA